MTRRRSNRAAVGSRFSSDRPAKPQVAAHGADVHKFSLSESNRGSEIVLALPRSRCGPVKNGCEKLAGTLYYFKKVLSPKGPTRHGKEGG